MAKIKKRQKLANFESKSGVSDSFNQPPNKFDELVSNVGITSGLPGLNNIEDKNHEYIKRT